MKKKLPYLLTLALLVLTPIGVFAQGDGGNGEGEGSERGETQGNLEANQVENQNETQTQNQGEEQQLQVESQYQEEEALMEGAENAQSSESSKEQGTEGQSQTKNSVDYATNKMKGLIENLDIETEASGLGSSIRAVVNQQIDAQEEMGQKIDKMEQRGSVVKFLVGPDYSSIKALKQQMEQNELRIKNLETYKNKLSNEGDITRVQETIQAMIDQNTALQDQINQEEGTFSLFGWLVKLFY